MSKKPGDSRERVYRYVRRRLLEGEPPTVRDVQEAMGFRAVESARKHLDALVGEGRLEKSPGKARGFRLPEADGGPFEGPTVRVPLLGDVHAGALTTAVEDPDGLIPVQTRLDPDELFALSVRGDSMVEAGIFEGDVVVVRRQPDAESGEIVVALVEDEATVKTLRKRAGRVELHPANVRYPVIVEEDLRLLGRVIEVRRKMA